MDRHVSIRLLGRCPLPCVVACYLRLSGFSMDWRFLEKNRHYEGSMESSLEVKLDGKRWYAVRRFNS